MNGEEAALTRRALLRLLCGGGALALGLDPGSIAHAQAGDPGGEVAAALARVGRRYLEIAPAERDRAVLAERLGILGTGAGVLAHVDVLEQAVRRDFERGDILALDGWILSRTELRAAAWLALTRPTAR